MPRRRRNGCSRPCGGSRVFDLAGLAAALRAHERVARVVIAGVEGSSPREVGASMLVWDQGQSGTIGGGALEHEASARARILLSGAAPTPSLPHEGGGGDLDGSIADRDGRGAAAVVERVALGPTLGQCCGGAVTLWTEVFEGLPVAEAGVIARGPGEMPLAVKRLLAAARGQGVRPATGVVAGWLVEAVAEAERQVWVWGAGHIGRALVAVLAPLPGVAVTWVDVAPERFPTPVPETVRGLPVAQPELAVTLAPPDAEHLVLTYSHALDLELCHRILTRGFRSCGLIGSATKWARFRSRLLALGHAAASVDRIDCPIGDPAFGKHPQAIAIGVAAHLLRPGTALRKRERA
ncbi:MAG: xanthine dehydrogenase accessory protein XdhC [Rhodobacterales bacterium 32-66-7]|nr:MAG: xanthine dehydrogenase accessory protein XdhC [Rhodobacterales bacterium 12-65-15]OYX22535.1 MAG: xanthine dehydrogenase accessory protein XdhC [Rhodobacterales bacterium 32-66-7]